MLSEKLSKFILWGLVVILVMGASAFSTWRTVALENQVKNSREIIARMKLEHEAAIIAANEAWQDRKVIYERAKERLCEAERKIGENSGFCDMDIPDDLRLLWEKPGDHPDSGIQSAH